MDDITLDLGGAAYRLRPMPARLYLAILRGEAKTDDMVGALDAACVEHPADIAAGGHPHETSLVDLLSIGALRRVVNEWIRASTDDPFPPADGPSSLGT